MRSIYLVVGEPEEPAAEPPPELELGLLGDEAPPEGLFSVSEEEELGEELDEELGDEGLDGVVAPEEEDEPDGEDGEVDDGLVDDPVPPVLPPPPCPQAVSALAPNAMETANANVESLMWPPWLG